CSTWPPVRSMRVSDGDEWAARRSSLVRGTSDITPQYDADACGLRRSERAAVAGEMGRVDRRRFREGDPAVARDLCAPFRDYREARAALAAGIGPDPGALCIGSRRRAGVCDRVPGVLFRPDLRSQAPAVHDRL